MPRGIRKPRNRNKATASWPITANSTMRKIQKATVSMRKPFAKLPIRPISATNRISCKKRIKCYDALLLTTHSTYVNNPTTARDIGCRTCNFRSIYELYRLLFGMEIFDSFFMRPRLTPCLLFNGWVEKAGKGLFLIFRLKIGFLFLGLLMLILQFLRLVCFDEKQANKMSLTRKGRIKLVLIFIWVFRKAIASWH